VLAHPAFDPLGAGGNPTAGVRLTLHSKPTFCRRRRLRRLPVAGRRCRPIAQGSEGTSLGNARSNASEPRVGRHLARSLAPLVRGDVGPDRLFPHHDCGNIQQVDLRIDPLCYPPDL